MKYQMPLQEAIDRIAVMKRYTEYHAKAGQPHHALTREEVAKEVESWGHDPKLAQGVGRIDGKSQVPQHKQNEGKLISVS